MDEEARNSSSEKKHIQQGPYDTPSLPTVRVGEHVCHAVIQKVTMISRFENIITVLPGSLPVSPG